VRGRTENYVQESILKRKLRETSDHVEGIKRLRVDWLGLVIKTDKKQGG
jgi:hypothetical protein